MFFDVHVVRLRRVCLPYGDAYTLGGDKAYEGEVFLNHPRWVKMITRGGR